MNNIDFPAEEYHSQINELNAQLALLKKKKNIISWSRLATVFLIIAGIWWFYNISILFTVIIALILAAIFLRLVILAVNNNSSIENIKQLVFINEQELLIAKGEYTHLPDGSNFLYPAHGYANDLDIFGRASVYQYINRTNSQQGNAKLAAWLLSPSEIEIIVERQAAAKELAPQYQWRQQLQAFGTKEPITLATEKKISGWIQQENTFSNNAGWKLLRWIYPFTTISIVILFLTDVLSLQWFGAAYIISLGIAALIARITLPQYMYLDKIIPEMDGLFKSAQWIESNSFKNKYLQQLQQYFVNGKNRSSVAIKNLKNILDKFDYSLNPALMLILNPLLLWNLQMIFQLEKWRAVNKTKTDHWFSALGEMEAVCTIANLQFNHPGWVFATFDLANEGVFSAKKMGHPLISADKMVYNDFSTSATGQISLITGSNMAGKSTFLRSTAINIVLAMMGAPVCANEMKLSPMRVISSMRVADNLEESTSTFYAELKKLKSIIECVNNHEKVFILLDEILRGTNSLDRHTGSVALIKQLINKKAVAMLATHDVELAQLQIEYPVNIHNYHFDAQIANEELYFDYLLKQGICKSINASILMKKIGIEL